MKKFALVLSGGGFKGAFQIGALTYLKENWSTLFPGQEEMKFDIVAGVSVGSLNGALIASKKFDELVETWRAIGENGVEEIYTSEFINTRSNSETLELDINFESLVRRFVPNLNVKVSFWDGLRLLFSQSRRDRFLFDILANAQQEFGDNFQKFRALANNDPLDQKLQKLLRREDIQDMVYKCGFVSLDSGNYYSLESQDFLSDRDFQKGVLASSSMPIVWEPVPRIQTRQETDIKNSVDGGIRNNSPLGDVIEEINKDKSSAEYQIIIINCNTLDTIAEDFDKANIAQIALRSLTDITLSEIFNNDLEEFLRVNDILEQIKEAQPDLKIFNYDFRTRKRTKEQLQTFQSLIIQPDVGTLGDTLVSTKALYNRRIAHGREKAMELVKKIQASKGNYRFLIS
ncbi:patatin-like phospholipase family protein [Pleomorphovibrio marinus]|uniref:patatin-like phospholipase family protein n=1 Tax=Pleomorphovibrio marinus TaxID=2164132 RepID=UPI000E0C3B52|nr:patatin-like phospholipase family protein [Pleomorphovibrio marinus]